MSRNQYFGYKYTKADTKKHKCFKCDGSGTYKWQTKYGVASGLCYQCQGKGWVSYRDDARNESYRQYNLWRT
jgi:DnaJ-class molecular chaperone